MNRSRDFRMHSNRAVPVDWLRNKHRAVWLTIAATLILCWVVARFLVRFQSVQLFTFCVTDYMDPIPPNAWAEQDYLNLRTVAGASHSEQMQKQSKAELLAQLEEFLNTAKCELYQAAWNNEPQALLLYFSALGIVDNDGRPCLLMSNSHKTIENDSGNFDSEIVAPLEEILETITKNARCRSAKKIIFLDCSKSLDIWKLGIASNPFAQAVSELDEAKLKNVYIVNSTSPMQVGHIAPERNGSAFGTFVAEALAGKADRNGDDRLTLAELELFLSTELNAWVVDHRADTQLVSIVSDKSIQPAETVVCGFEQKKAWAPSPAPLEEEAQTLNDIWEKFEKKVDFDQAVLRQPLQLANAMHGLCRLESLWQGGYALGKKDRPARTRFDKDRKTVAKLVNELVDIEQFNMPFVGLGIAKPPQRLGDMQKLQAWWDAPAAKQSEVLASDKAAGDNLLSDQTDAASQRDASSNSPGKPESSAKPASSAGVEPGNLTTPSYSEGLLFAWNQVQQSSPTQFTATMRKALEKTGSLLDLSKPKAKEHFLLELMSRGLPGDHGKAGLAVAQLFDLGEQASSPADVRALQWVRNDCDRSDKNFRKQVLDAFFCSALKPDRIEQLKKDCNATRQLGGEGSRALIWLDHCYAIYPWLGEYVVPLKTQSDQRIVGFHAALEECLRVRGQLRSEALPQGFHAPTIDLHAHIDSFARQLTQEKSGVTARNLHDYLSLLKIPVPFHGRKTMRTKFLSALAELPQKGDLIARQSTEPYEHPLARLLELRQPPNINESPNALQVAGAASASIRKAIVTEAERLKNEREQKRALLYRQRADESSKTRLVASLITNAEFLKSSSYPDQAQIYLAESEREYKSFQAERICQDFWGDLESGDYYFDEAAVALLGDNSQITALRNIAKSWNPVQGQIEWTNNDGDQHANFQIQPSPAIPVGISRLTFRQDTFGGSPLKPVPVGMAESSGIKQSVAARLESEVRADLFYRGHMRTAVSVVKKLSNRQYTNSRPAMEDAIVKLPQLPPREVDIVFVIDCSGSMGNRDATSPGNTRNHIAIDQLRASLSDLSDWSKQLNWNLRAGFVLFGHRCYWTRTGETFQYNSKNGLSIAPGDDVERLWGGDFKPISKIDFDGELKSRMDAKGESPLFYAINEGMDTLQSSKADQRLLVVLTDEGGGNVKWDSEKPPQLNTYRTSDPLVNKWSRLASLNNTSALIMCLGNRNLSLNKFPRTAIHTINQERLMSELLLNEIQKYDLKLRIEQGGALLLDTQPGKQVVVRAGESFTVGLQISNDDISKYDGSLATGQLLELKYEPLSRQLSPVPFNFEAEGFKRSGDSRFWFKREKAGRRVTIQVATDDDPRRKRCEFVRVEIWPIDKPQDRSLFQEPYYLPRKRVPILEFSNPEWRDSDELCVQFWRAETTEFQELKAGEFLKIETTGNPAKLVELRSTTLPLHQFVADPMPAQVIRRWYEAEPNKEATHETVFHFQDMHNLPVKILSADFSQWESSGEFRLAP